VTSPSEPPGRRRTPWQVALALVAAATLVRLAIGGILPLVPDEAYYWDWSRRLAPGYFDHPPAIALLIRSGTFLFGPTSLGVRLWPIMAAGATLVVVATMARELDGERAVVWTALLFVCMPLSAVGSMIATPDAPALLATSLTLLAVMRALSSDTAERAVRWWLLAGLALGAGLASKYTVVLVAAGVLVAIIARPRLRPVLSTPGPYLGAGVALALFAPVVLWNASHHYASFRFQLGHGLGSGGGSALGREMELLAGQLALASPILFPLMALAVVRSLRRNQPDDRQALLAIVSLVVFLFFCASAMRKRVEANWPALAYIPAAALLGAWPSTERERRWLAVGCAVAGAISVMLLAHIIHPFTFVPAGEDPTAQLRGWDSLAVAVAAARAGPDSDRIWVGAGRYQDAAELAFNLRSHPTVFVPNSGGRLNQYDIWPGFFERGHRGDGLVLATAVAQTTEEPSIVRTLRPHFDSVSLRSSVAVERRGDVFFKRAVWVLVGWRGTWPATTAKAP